MKKHYLLAIIVVITFMQCKKHDSPPPPPNTTVTPTNLFSIDTATVFPSSIVILKCNNPITKDTATINVGGKFVLIAKIDTFQYSMIVPIISPGKYQLTLTGLNAANSPEITIGNYTPITSATTVLNTFSIQFKALIDTLLKTKYKTIISVSDSLFLRQAMSQFDKNLQTATEAQKLEMAYYVKLIDINPANSKGSAGFDTSYIKLDAFNTFSLIPKTNGLEKSIKLLGSPYGADELEVGQQLWNKALESAKRTQIAVASILPVMGTGYLALVQPETVPLFLAALLNYKFQMLAAKESIGEAANLVAIAEDVEPDAGINGNVITANKNTPVWEKIKAKFRTINNKDADDPYFGEIIRDDSQLQETDNKVKSRFEALKKLFSVFFDNIAQTLSGYVSQIKPIVTEKSVEVNNRFLTVSNVSNADITVSIADDGVKGLKITATNPNNNITTSTPFSFLLKYVQAAFNKTVSVTEQGIFVPAAPVTLSTTNISSITTTSAASGGNITSDGGSAITARGICWNTSTNPTTSNNKTVSGSGIGIFASTLSGLLANTKYYVRAFATNGNGTFYGNELTFTTSQGQVPTVTTSTISLLTSSGVTSGGNISSDGGTTVSARGICWNTSGSPTIANSKTMDGSGTGLFVSNVTGLVSGTKYYVRAYATNAAGTGYGSEASFTTIPAGWTSVYVDIPNNVNTPIVVERVEESGIGPSSNFIFDKYVYGTGSCLGKTTQTVLGFYVWVKPGKSILLAIYIFPCPFTTYRGVYYVSVKG